MPLRMLLPLSLLLLLCACDGAHLPSRVQRIENLELIRTMGVDADEAGVLVTLGGGRHQTAGGGEPAPPVAAAGAAATISLAAQRLQTAYDRYMFYGHVSEYLVGEALAARGIAPYLDYMERSVDMRLNTNLYIVKGGTANGMITAAAGARPLNERLESLKETAGLTSETYPFTVRTTIMQLERSGSALCPALLAEPGEDGGAAGQSVRAAGYAVLADYRLVGYLDGDAAKGVNLLLDEVTTDVVEVRTGHGVLVALHIAGCETRIKPEFEGDALRRVRIVTRLDANVGEVEGEADLTDPLLTQALARQLETISRGRMEGVLALAQEWESDFLSIGPRVGQMAPARWGALRGEWDTLFPALEIEVAVHAVIRRGYDSDAAAGGADA